MFASKVVDAARSMSTKATRPGAWPSSPFTFSRAIVRGLAPDFAEKALRQSPSSNPINMAAATQQHKTYVDALKAVLPAGGVVELAPGGGPDCVFVEDTAVCVGSRALVTRPGAGPRRGETPAVRDALVGLGMDVVEMVGPARLDGGDVLFTGREFFVGLSKRTNREGVQVLRQAFPGYRVTPIPLTAESGRGAHARKRQAVTAQGGSPHAPLISQPTAPLHLKSLVTLIGVQTFAVADTELGHSVAFAMQDLSGTPRSQRFGGEGRLSFVLVPDWPAANAVFVNGTLLVRSGSEYPDSVEQLAHYAEDTGLSLVEVNGSELAKADGALSCCSLLLHA